MGIFKSILMHTMNILKIPFAIILCAGIMFYVFPILQETSVGLWLLQTITPNWILAIVIASGALFVLFSILLKIFNKYASAKFKNFFIRINGWVMCAVIGVLTIIAFILSPISIDLDLTLTRKIGIGVCFILLFLAYLFSDKIAKIVNRKIQSYNNARELNVVGRSSIFFVNVLRLLELLFPQLLVLVLVCFCLSFNAALFFLMFIVAAVIPMLANIDCDLNTRFEIKLLKDHEHKKFVQDVVDTMRRGE